MPSEKLSTHEIRMARNAERERHARMGTTPTVATVRTQPHPEERAQAARLSAARALPDTLFDDDPEVQRLRAAASLKVHLIEKRVQVRDWLVEQQSRLYSFIEEAARAVPQAILEDAAGQDEGFTKTRETLAALDFAKSVRAGIDAAYAMVAQSIRNAIRAEGSANLLPLLLRQEPGAWELRFAPDYYHALARITGTVYTGHAGGTPALYGAMTDKWVYGGLLPDDVHAELKIRRGASRKMHQWLTDGGQELLDKQIDLVRSIANTSADMRDFEARMMLLSGRRGQLGFIYPKAA